MEAGMVCDSMSCALGGQLLGKLSSCCSVSESVTTWRWAPLAMPAAFLMLLGVV